MIYLTKENHLLCETLGYLQEQFNGSPDDHDKEKKVLFQISQILENIPSLINYASLAKNIQTNKNIIDFILLQEVLFYLKYM